MTTGFLPQLLSRHSGAARISVLFLIAAYLTVFAASAYAQQPVNFNKVWWNSLDKDEHWDFVYGFHDCGKRDRSGLSTAQFEDFISENVDSAPDSVPKPILLAPSRVKRIPQATRGEVWTERHGFNDGDLWGDDAGEGRAWVEGYFACEHRPADLASVDRYVRLIIRHYANPARHVDKLANVLEPLLPPLKSATQR